LREPGRVSADVAKLPAWLIAQTTKLQTAKRRKTPGPKGIPHQIKTPNLASIPRAATPPNSEHTQTPPAAKRDSTVDERNN
jgi:hypothetical protein